MIRQIIEIEEGFRAHPYLCSEGFVTIGYGTKLHDKKGQNPNDFSLVVSEDAAFALLKDKVSYIKTRLMSGRHSRTYQGLSQNRKDILVSMAYQLGTSGLYNFKKMWAALAEQDYDTASVEMMDSRWAKQTPERARRHADAIDWDTLEEYK